MKMTAMSQAIVLVGDRRCFRIWERRIRARMNPSEGRSYFDRKKNDGKTSKIMLYDIPTGKLLKRLLKEKYWKKEE